MKKNDLEERLIDFAVAVLSVSKEIAGSGHGAPLSKQLTRSGTSSALNYGEAQSAESKRDFVHKMKIAQKELRETYVCLRIIHRAKLYKTEELLLDCMKENNELISIFVKSMLTAEKGMRRLP